jgi:regulator of nucleoside diphosphate kinase
LNASIFLSENLAEGANGAFLADRSVAMATKPTALSSNPVVLTDRDFDRLHQLVQCPRYRSTHPTVLLGLKDELDRGTVVSPGTVSRDVVTMHSRVRVRDLRSKRSETYALVYPEEANVDEGKLSVLAPLGTALLGSRAGQAIDVRTPGGQRRLRIERVLYQPEAAGEFHR